MTRILVSGASGIVGYGILKSLGIGNPDLELIGTTIYNDSVAPGFCDILEIAPPTIDSSYIPWLLNVIDNLHVDLIIPSIEIDLYTLVEHRVEIERQNCKIVLNNPNLISLCKDKWLFYKYLQENNLPYAIKSTLENNFEYLQSAFGLPFLLKPRRGFGSKGIIIIDSESVYDHYGALVGENLMVQPLIGTEEEEFTVSVFGDGLGSYSAHITLQRKLSSQGFTEKALVCELEEGESVFKDLCSYFKPLGPTNFQFRRDNGNLMLLEINPRISSSTSIRTAFGYNECIMAVEYYLDNVLPQQPEISQGYAVRYTEDMVFYDNRYNI